MYKVKTCFLHLLFAYLGMSFFPQTVFAQTKQVYRTFLNKSLKPLPSEKFAFAIEERWQEKGVWKAKLINNETGKVMAEYGYADSTRNTKHGSYIEYYDNRKKKVEYTYINGEIDGYFEEWYSDGVLFQKGTRTGEAYWGHFVQNFADGSLKMEADLDINGNGTGVETLAKAGLKGKGEMRGGKQWGAWAYSDENGQKMMEVVYNQEGTIDKETCFDAQGKPVTDKPCISDRRPEFPGGADGWAKFLQKNLTYPKEARKSNIQGVVLVKFFVKEDGSISNIKVVQSPDPELSAETLRVMRLSPKWTPAIEFNKAVPFTHIQAITFQLK
jgi:TonB family protein